MMDVIDGCHRVDWHETDTRGWLFYFLGVHTAHKRFEQAGRKRTRTNESINQSINQTPTPQIEERGK